MFFGKGRDPMLARPMDILQQFPVRKSKQQKQVFRDAVLLYARDQGYEAAVETGKLGVHNVVIGNPESAKYLVTAHYDTCANMLLPNYITPCNFLPYIGYQLLLTFLIIEVSVALGVLTGLVWAPAGPVVGYLCVWILLALMLFGPANSANANDNTSGIITALEIARTMPENQRHKVCFVLFDLEEAGLLGSATYRKLHKNATDNQIILNLDCVGDGDHIRLFPTKKLKKDRRKLTALYKTCGYFGPKNILVHEKGFSVYPSDHKNFPFGVGICALKKGKFGLCMDRIHTNKDTILEETNVNILRAALTSYICCDS